MEGKTELCDPSLTRANLSALEMTIAHNVKRYTNVLFTLLTYYTRHACERTRALCTVAINDSLLLIRQHCAPVQHGEAVYIL